MFEPVDAEAESKGTKIDVCLHLGTEENSSLFCQEPTPRHRCYLRPQGDRVDLALQASFCLTSSHTLCPWLSISNPISARLDGRAVALRRAAGQTMRHLPERIRSFAVASWVWLRPILVRLGFLIAALAVMLWRHMHPAPARAARFAWAMLRRGFRGLGSLARRAVGTVLARFRRAPRIAVPASFPAVGAAGTSPASPAVQTSLEAARSVEQGILAVREGSREVAYALFVQATELDAGYEQGWLWRAAMSRSMEEKRECLEQILRVSPESASAKAALALLDQPEPDVPKLAKLAPGPAVAGAAGASPSVVSRTLSVAPAKPPATTWHCAGCETINVGPSRVCRSCGRPSPEVEEELISSGDDLLAQGLSGLKAGNEELAYHYFVMATEASPRSELAWQWRAKTALTLDEVITCLKEVLKLNPENAKVQSNLSWAIQRQQREQSLPGSSAAQPAVKKTPKNTAPRRLPWRLRWWLLQIAGMTTFAVALALALPYGARFVDALSVPAVKDYLKLLPSVLLPEWQVQAPYLPEFNAGSFLPLVLGLLLLHAAFLVADGGGLAARIWTAILGAAAAWMIMYFGTNPPFSTYAAGIAALAAATALLGGTPAASKPKHWVGSAAGDW